MSLFKVRDFWSFDLGQLPAQYSCSQAAAIERADLELARDDNLSLLDSTERSAGNFIASIGRFHSIGHHDVFVCADILDGFIFVIQVPESDQIKHTKTQAGHLGEDIRLIRNPERRWDDSGSEIGAENETTSTSTTKDSHHKSNAIFKDRQLLVAKRLGFPIVDVKCGFFTSALKQSIAVLGFDKIVFYQVKRHQVDLLSADPPLRPATSASQQQRQTSLLNKRVGLDENLFSHELEEHYRLDLLTQELASNILVLDNHSECSLSKSPNSGHHHLVSGADLSPTKSHHHHKDSGKHPAAQHFAQQLHLPQRDTIVVQYTNQFLLSLIDYKKIVGHFSLSDATTTTVPTAATSGAKGDDSTNGAASTADYEGHIQQLAQFVGTMPVAFLRDSARGSSLVLSMSDNRLYCLSLAKLITQAKQNVMKRVAQDLLHENSNSSSSSIVAGATRRSSLAYDRLAGRGSDLETKIEVDSSADWTFELACAPVQMVGVQHHGRSKDSISSAAGGHASATLATSQLLVMSRYNLDLFNNLGQHMWSQRFETPLICMHSHIVSGVVSSLAPPSTTRRLDDSGSNKCGGDRMLTLLCTDCLSTDKSNLLILEEDRIVWSALLNTKPLQLWRANLGRMSGTLATLDVGQGHLSTSYLGTNLENNDQELYSEAQNSCELAQLELMNEPLFRDSTNSTVGATTIDETGAIANVPDSKVIGYESRKLKVDIKLEAFEQWPNVYVDGRISIAPTSSSVLQNIVVTIEFDDLICFESTTNASSVMLISDGVVQILLGNCWPDRQEPMSLAGRFALRSSQQIGTKTLSRNINTTNSSSANKQQVFTNSSNLYLMPKSLKVNLYFRFNEAHSGLSLQEESFQLPLNIIARLVHIDYSSGQNQSLDDVQANLNLYKRPSSKYRGTRDSILSSSSNQRDNSSNNTTTTNELEATESPYYLCDLVVRTGCDVIDLVDEIIESDLVCRGLNSESMNYTKLEGQRRERKLSTLENINLLSQSLDCRLKYKSFSHPSTSVVRQSSEDYSPAVLISIALKISNGDQLISSHLIEKQKQQRTSNETTTGGEESTFAIVWLHLCDLAASESVIPGEIIGQHIKEWKIYADDSELTYNNNGTANIDEIGSNVAGLTKTSDTRINGRPTLISIECDHPTPVLFLQSHLIERLKKRSANSSKILNGPVALHLSPLTESVHDAIEINYQNVLKINNFFVMSVNLHDRLILALDQYKNELVNEFERLKGELRREHYKFHVTAMSSLSLSKRLHKLPDHMHKQFITLSQLTKQYQLNLIRILIKLEKLKGFDYRYSKIPSASYIILKTSGKQGLVRWPTISQIID